VSRGTDDGRASRKLIDTLYGGPDLGDVTAVLATTFDLNPDFFETDFLPSLLGVPVSPGRAWRTRVQMESELASLDTVAVLMEATRWHGRPRTLRVHVQPAKAPDRGVLHAKVVLVVHEDAVRLVVGSANLTESGYRSNREVAVAIAVTKKTRENGALIRQAMSGLADRLRPWWSESAARVVASAVEVLNRLGSPEAAEDESFVWGGEPEPLFQKVLAAWPSGEPLRRLRIVSPFWSEETGGGPIAQLLRGLSGRGAATKDAEVLLVTSALPDGTQTWRPELPASYGTFDFAALGVRVSAVPAKVLVDAEDVGRDDLLARRALHAKVVFLEGPKTSLAYLGSANFTVPGWGFGALQHSNVEAGLLVRRQGKARAQFEELIPPLEGSPIRLEGTVRAIVPPPPELPVASEWPGFLHSVELRTGDAKPDILELVAVLNDGPEPRWSLTFGANHSPRVAVTDVPGQLTRSFALDGEDLRTLISRQVVRVRWEGGPEPGVDYPVNVSLEARNQLPFGDPRLLPSEDDLVAFFQGRIALEDLFPPPPGVDGDDDASVPATESAVDTSKILSYQVRSFVEALAGLRDELERNTATERSMRLAVLGPVSPVALAREIAQAAAKGRSATAVGFQLAEILCVLRAARSFDVDPKLAAPWAEILRKGEAEVSGRLDALRAAHPTLADRTAFGAYVKAATKAALESRS
jgi:hypothetical protein